MRIRPFVFILGLSALLIAGCAAFFSVSGLASLFTGAFWAVAIMAGVLEFGKLVAASYLHRYWDRTPFLHKVYLIIGVISLMVITSAGIFGFLTSAYQEAAGELQTQDQRIATLENRKELVQTQVSEYRGQRSNLIDLRQRQTTRLDSLYQRQWYNSATRTEDRIDNINSQIEDYNDQISTGVDSIAAIDSKILEIQSNSQVSREIGPLLYVAREFNTDIDTAVKWFTFLLIFVFDPMAVALVIAYNNVIVMEYKDKYGSYAAAKSKSDGDGDDPNDDDENSGGPDDGGDIKEDDPKNPNPENGGSKKTVNQSFESENIDSEVYTTDKPRDMKTTEEVVEQLENHSRGFTEEESKGYGSFTDDYFETVEPLEDEVTDFYGDDQIDEILKSTEEPEGEMVDSNSEKKETDEFEQIVNEIEEKESTSEKIDDDVSNDNMEDVAESKSKATKRVDFHNGKKSKF